MGPGGRQAQGIFISSLGAQEVTFCGLALVDTVLTRGGLGKSLIRVLPHL